MPRYTSLVNATSNSSGGTEDTFIDIDAAASQVFKVYRIRVSINTAASDGRTQVRVYRKTAIGSGSTTGTIVKLDPLTPASAAAVTIKNGTSTYASGTTGDKLMEAQFNNRGVFEWVARDTEDMIRSGSGDMIGVNIVDSANSIITVVEVWWEE